MAESVPRLDMAMRATGIGASEIAAICGLSPYNSPLDIYLRKLGLVEDAPLKNPYVTWGVRLEQPIADAYAEETGAVLAGDGRTTVRSIDHDFALCTPDRWIEGPPRKLVEIKTTDSRNAKQWGPSGTDEVPEYYLVQCAWQMAVMDCDHCDLVVLIGGNDMRIYPLKRDRELEARLLEIGRQFWSNHVTAQVPPEPRDESERGRYLGGLYPQHSGEYLENDSEVDRLALLLRETRATKAEIERTEDQVINDLKAHIGERPGAKGFWGSISWKTTAARPLTDLKALVAELDPPAELLAKHTTIKPGVRRFLPTFKKGGDE